MKGVYFFWDFIFSAADQLNLLAFYEFVIENEKIMQMQMKITCTLSDISNIKNRL